MTLINISDSNECSKDSIKFSPFLFADDNEDEASSPVPKSTTNEVVLNQSARKSNAKRKGKQVVQSKSDRPSKKTHFKKDFESRAIKDSFYLDCAVAVHEVDDGLKKAKKGNGCEDIVKSLKSFADSMFQLQVSMTTYFNNQVKKMDMWERRLKSVTKEVNNDPAFEESLDGTEEFEALMAGPRGKN